MIDALLDDAIKRSACSVDSPRLAAVESNELLAGCNRALADHANCLPGSTGYASCTIALTSPPTPYSELVLVPFFPMDAPWTWSTTILPKQVSLTRTSLLKSANPYSTRLSGPSIRRGVFF
ncbi:hypothetical protein, partial [Burkholderia sp. BCC1977]|uniref:hypothetical protein n=1 Tax=Burkholderia sp. BCC1977 TaxID=2817440 RepID=UPI002ABE0471